MSPREITIARALGAAPVRVYRDDDGDVWIRQGTDKVLLDPHAANLVAEAVFTLAGVSA